MKNIILCGMPKSGKTTLGKLLAKKLFLPFVDTDRLIEKLYSKIDKSKPNCREIFKQKGEVYFRELEKEALRSLKTYSNYIISLGGGALNDPENVKELKRLGSLVYIKVPPLTLWKRLKTPLPAYIDIQEPEKSFQKLFNTRDPIFSAAADLIFEAGSLKNDELIPLLATQVLPTLVG